MFKHTCTHTIMHTILPPKPTPRGERYCCLTHGVLYSHLLTQILFILQGTFSSLHNIDLLCFTAHLQFGISCSLSVPLVLIMSP